MLTSCCYCFLNCIHFSSFQNSDCFRVTERTTEYNAIPRCMAVMLLWILNNKPIDTKRYDIHWGLLFLVLIRFPMCISFTIMIHFPSFAWKWWTKLQFNMQETLGGNKLYVLAPLKFPRSIIVSGWWKCWSRKHPNILKPIGFIFAGKTIMSIAHRITYSPHKTIQCSIFHSQSTLFATFCSIKLRFPMFCWF